jgi:hypothetical protein
MTQLQGRKVIRRFYLEMTERPKNNESANVVHAQSEERRCTRSGVLTSPGGAGGRREIWVLSKAECVIMVSPSSIKVFEDVKIGGKEG